MVKKWRMDY